MNTRQVRNSVPYKMPSSARGNKKIADKKVGWVESSTPTSSHVPKRRTSNTRPARTSKIPTLLHRTTTTTEPRPRLHLTSLRPCRALLFFVLSVVSVVRIVPSPASGTQQHPNYPTYVRSVRTSKSRRAQQISNSNFPRPPARSPRRASSTGAVATSLDVERYFVAFPLSFW